MQQTDWESVKNVEGCLWIYQRKQPRQQLIPVAAATAAPNPAPVHCPPLSEASATLQSPTCCASHVSHSPAPQSSPSHDPAHSCSATSRKVTPPKPGQPAPVAQSYADPMQYPPSTLREVRSQHLEQPAVSHSPSTAYPHHMSGRKSSLPSMQQVCQVMLQYKLL